MLQQGPERPELAELLRQAMIREDAKTPAQKAEDQLRQSRSYVVSEMQMGDDNGSGAVSADRAAELFDTTPTGWAIKEIDALRAALKPFAFLGSILTGKEKDSSIFVGQATYDEKGNPTHHPVTFGDLRHANAILTK